MPADVRETQLSIPKDGKAAIFTQKGGPVAVKTQAVPQEKDLKPGEALVRVIYSGGEFLEISCEIIEKTQSSSLSSDLVSLFTLDSLLVCHTDLHAMLGDWPVPNKLPLVGGHEG